MSLTRRSLLAAAAASLAAPAMAAAAPSDDAAETEALRGLIVGELGAALAYPSASLGALGATLAGHQIEHAQALSVHLQALAAPVPPAPTAAQLPPAAARLQHAGGRAAALALEHELAAACARALPVLTDPGTLRTVATVMASHAQHLAVLSSNRRSARPH